MGQLLSDLKVGDTAKIVDLLAIYPTYRQKLLALGLLPGASLRVIRHAPFGCPLEIELNGFTLSLRKTESALVEVETY